MKRRRLFTVLMAAVVLTAGPIVAGCDDDDSSSSSGSMTAEQFVDSYIENMCAKHLECCPNGIESDGSPITTMDDCKAEMNMYRAFMLAAFTDPKVVFDEHKAAACDAAMESRLDSMDCSDSLNDLEGIPECKEMVQGTVNEGGTCSSDIECKNDMNCLDDKCTATKPNGEACSDDDECASDYCDNGVCTEEQSSGGDPITDSCYEPDVAN